MVLIQMRSARLGAVSHLRVRPGAPDLPDKPPRILRSRTYEFVKTGPLALVPFVVVTVTTYVPAGAVVGEIAVIVVDPTT